MKWLLLIIGVLLTGCGLEHQLPGNLGREKRQPARWSKEFDPYVRGFMDFGRGRVHGHDGKMHNVTDERYTYNLVVEMGDKDEFAKTVAGSCSIYFYDRNDETPEVQTRLVLINPTLWASAIDSERQALIWHELGHCVLMRGHDNAILEFTKNGEQRNRKQTLMNEVLVDNDTYQEFLGYYQTELFAVSDPETETDFQEN
jgi:hypothetical protein